LSCDYTLAPVFVNIEFRECKKLILNKVLNLSKYY
jgi:hypothetical protein